MNRKGTRQCLIITPIVVLFVRYEIELRAAKKSGIRKGAINGLLVGVIFCLMFSTYALVIELLFNIYKYTLIVIIGFLVWS